MWWIVLLVILASALVVGGVSAFSSWREKRAEAKKKAEDQEKKEEKIEELKKLPEMLNKEREAKAKPLATNKQDGIIDALNDEAEAVLAPRERPTVSGSETIVEPPRRTESTIDNIDTHSQTQGAKKITLDGTDSLVGEKGVLYEYCMENANRLYTHRIKSIGKSIAEIKNNPELAEKIASSINGLEPEQYEEKLNEVSELIKTKSKNQELRVLRDVLEACTHMSGAREHNPFFLKGERAFNENEVGFIDAIQDEELRKKFKALVTTSEKPATSIAEKAKTTRNIGEVIDNAGAKPSIVGKVIPFKPDLARTVNRGGKAA